MRSGGCLRRSGGSLRRTRTASCSTAEWRRRSKKGRLTLNGKERMWQSGGINKRMTMVCPVVIPWYYL
nr:MAG TPA: hypothetical protein [Caudoviricetes sp.]